MAEAEFPQKEAQTESVLGSNVSDRPTKDDSLGFKPYVAAIRDFLTNDSTRGPLTLSVEGEWGTGKSSFMQQLAEALGEDHGKVVEFNAWRHEKLDALWAAFVLKFVEDLSRKMSWQHRALAGLRLAWIRYDGKAGWFNSLLFLTGAAFFALAIGLTVIYLMTGGWESILRLARSGDILKAIGLTGGFAGSVVSFLYILKKAFNLAVTPLAIDLRKYLDMPDYRGCCSFIERFHRDFSRVVKIYADRGKKVFVLIDDLDRCEVPRAAELMQAINLMISDASELFFIIGMDREKIAAGLAVKFEKLLPYLASRETAGRDQAQKTPDPLSGLEYGYNFVEKFVQLPFLVPQPSRTNFRKFMSTLDGAPDSSEGPDEEAVSERPDLVEIVNDKDSPRFKGIVLTVAPALDFNPRRIKQFVNLFRLKAHIASRTGLFTQTDPGSPYVPLTLERLGKFVALILRWPLLANDLAADHTLLDTLQRIAWGETESTTSRWASKPKLIGLLQEGFEMREDYNGKRMVVDLAGAPGNIYSLLGMDIGKLLQVSPLRKQRTVKDTYAEKEEASSYRPVETPDIDGASFREDHDYESKLKEKYRLK
jgi:hypothetical protein